ncbi:hypothetical protein FB451DRAFT_1536755 [Mycena latifolia]|nr:hypothetical protein FB451DRAFT_1536755 [Mycena latifolia]
MQINWRLRIIDWPRQRREATTVGTVSSVQWVFCVYRNPSAGRGYCSAVRIENNKNEVYNGTNTPALCPANVLQAIDHPGFTSPGAAVTARTAGAIQNLWIQGGVGSEPAARVRSVKATAAAAEHITAIATAVERITVIAVAAESMKAMKTAVEREPRLNHRGGVKPGGRPARTKTQSNRLPKLLAVRKKSKIDHPSTSIHVPSIQIHPWIGLSKSGPRTEGQLERGRMGIGVRDVEQCGLLVGCTLEFPSSSSRRENDQQFRPDEFDWRKNRKANAAQQEEDIQTAILYNDKTRLQGYIKLDEMVLGIHSETRSALPEVAGARRKHPGPFNFGGTILSYRQDTLKSGGNRRACTFGHSFGMYHAPRVDEGPKRPRNILIANSQHFSTLHLSRKNIARDTSSPASERRTEPLRHAP